MMIKQELHHHHRVPEPHHRYRIPEPHQSHLVNMQEEVLVYYIDIHIY